MSACAPNDRLMQTLRVHVPGATDPLIELELFNVMDEFFRRTSAWNYTTDIELVEGQAEYGFGTPADTNVVRLMGVMHQGNQVPSAMSLAQGVVQTSVGTLDPSEVFPDGDIALAPSRTDLVGNVFSYAIYRPGYIQLTSMPDEEARKFPLKAILALTLARSCLETDCGDWAVEDWMWDMYFQDWLDGSMARLYGMPAKPWSSALHAQYHGKRFRNAMAYRKQEAIRGLIWNQSAWRFPRGW
jgi:hypothetical protein